MAGYKHKNQSLDGPNKGVNQRTRRAKAKKRKGIRLAAEVAEAQGFKLQSNTGASTLDALQFVLDRSLQLLKWACAETDKVSKDEFWLKSIDAQGNIVTKHHWTYELETNLRAEVLDIASKMEGLDIAARRTALAEAQASLVQRYMKAVLDQLELTPAQRKALGPALRSALPLIEGTSHEIVTPAEQAA